MNSGADLLFLGKFQWGNDDWSNFQTNMDTRDVGDCNGPHPHLSGQTCFQCLDIEVSHHHGTAVYCMDSIIARRNSQPHWIVFRWTPPKLIGTDRPFPSIISIHFQHRVPPVFRNVNLDPPGLGDVTSIERRELSTGLWVCELGPGVSQWVIECHNVKHHPQIHQVGTYMCI